MEHRQNDPANESILNAEHFSLVSAEFATTRESYEGFSLISAEFATTRELKNFLNIFVGAKNYKFGPFVLMPLPGHFPIRLFDLLDIVLNCFYNVHVHIVFTTFITSRS